MGKTVASASRQVIVSGVEPEAQLNFQVSRLTEAIGMPDCLFVRGLYGIPGGEHLHAGSRSSKGRGPQGNLCAVDPALGLHGI